MGCCQSTENLGESPFTPQRRRSVAHSTDSRRSVSFDDRGRAPSPEARLTSCASSRRGSGRASAYNGSCGTDTDAHGRAIEGFAPQGDDDAEASQRDSLVVSHVTTESATHTRMGDALRRSYCTAKEDHEDVVRRGGMPPPPPPKPAQVLKLPRSGTRSTETASPIATPGVSRQSSFVRSAKSLATLSSAALTEGTVDMSVDTTRADDSVNDSLNQSVVTKKTVGFDLDRPPSPARLRRAHTDSGSILHELRGRKGRHVPLPEPTMMAPMVWQFPSVTTAHSHRRPTNTQVPPMRGPSHVDPMGSR
jgi:hypothetical protein